MKPDRRKMLALLSGIPLIGAAFATQATEAPAPVLVPDWVPITLLPLVKTFKELEAALAGLPDQCIGRPMAFCENGLAYVTVHESALARPADVATIEAKVVDRMASRLTTALGGAEGRIYWRNPLEWDIEDTYVIERFADDGDFVDFLTDRRCFVDRNWKRVTGYARLSRSLKGTA